VTTRAAIPPSVATLPPAVVALLAGAAAHLGIRVWAQSVMAGYLDLSAAALIGQLASAMPLVLAASLVAGRDRWPAARGWLLAAAVAYAAGGILDAAGWVWWALVWPPDPAQTGSVAVLARGTLLVASALAAPALAATGLWRVATGGPGHHPAWLRVGIALVAAVLVIQAVGIGLWVDDLQSLDAGSDQSFAAALSALGEVVPVLLAALGVAALRALPRRYLLPEALVAIGATLAAVAMVAATAALVAAREGVSATWLTPIVTAGYGGAVVGLAIVALGFFTARISAPGEA
jgi:hypothetical protein